MTATHAEQIIAGYMKRLDSELSAVPSGRRKEIETQIAEHIAQARSELREETDADVLTILDRLGEPDEIASEAKTRLDVPAGNPGPVEIAALLLIGVGGVLVPIFPITWIVGAALVWRSGAWSPREKRRGVYAPLVVALGLLVVGALLGSALGKHLVLTTFFLAAVLSNLLMPLASALYLGFHLGRRMPLAGWAAIVLVALLLYIPAAATLMPPTLQGFVGSAGELDGAAPDLTHPGCGGFYGTVNYSGWMHLRASAPVSVGVCWNGSQITKNWGPDCYPSYGPALVVKVQGCQAELQQDGSLIVSIESSATALTAPFFGTSRSDSWRITPDGHVMTFGG